MVHAYHNLCKACAEKRNVCAKCTNSDEIVNQEEPDLTRELEAKLKTFKERTRRTLVRKLDKGEIQPAEVLEMEVKPKRSQSFCGSYAVLWKGDKRKKDDDDDSDDSDGNEVDDLDEQDDDEDEGNDNNK